MKKYAILCLVLCAALLAGCAPREIVSEYAVPVELSPAMTKSSAPSPSQSPAFGPEDLEKIGGKFSIDMDLSGISFQTSQQFCYETIIANMPVYQKFASRVEQAYRSAFQTYERKYGVPFSVEVEIPGWKAIAALLESQGNDAETCAKILEASAGVSLKVQESGVLAQVSWPEFGELMEKTAGDNANEYMSGRFLYSYLMTVYDKNGEETEFKSEPLPEGLTLPIPDMEIRNTWYNDRSQGTRKHTGMDIRSPEDTPILACKSGIVRYVGANEGAGNYVVIAGEDGYEYHYYHMVRLPTQVKRGDRVAAGDEIGNVGNTGNSDANHLHLTIVGKGGAYINPYDCFKGEKK